MGTIPLNAIRSESNSTTTALSAGATYTGTAEHNTYCDVMVSVKTDQNGTLYMDFSPDGTNWDSTLSFKYDTNRINAPHILVKGNRWYRTRFTNDSASAQTYLRLQTDFGTFQKLTAPINGTLSENYDAIVARTTDYHYEVAMGKRQGRTVWNKFGYNEDIDSGQTEVIWSTGGALTILTSASTLDVVSSSANDIVTTGSGARVILIDGIDANWERQTETVNMNGIGTATTTNSFLGVNRAYVITSGASDSNEGNITITATTGGSTQAQIPAGGGVTQQLIFFTQANHTALADWLFFNVNKLSGGGGNPRITIKGWSYSYVVDCKYEVFRYTIDTGVENKLELNPSQPFVIGGKEVLYFEATSDTNNAVIAGRFSLIEERIS